MLPKPCMALMSLMIVCLRLMLMLPLARQAAITMGSISGIKPTATDKAKARDSNHRPPVTHSRIKTIGTSTAVKRSSTQAMELAPW